MAAMPNPIQVVRSVGRNCNNDRSDVFIVQELINEHLPIPLAPLRVDGLCGPSTIFAIEEIQRRNLHMKCPNGRVDPDGPTFGFLSGSGTRKTASANATAAQLVGDPRVRAMLDVLGFTEGTGTNYGKVANGLVLKSPYYPELVGKRNVSVTNLTRHPDILVQWSPTITTTAAGRSMLEICQFYRAALQRYPPLPSAGR